MGTQRLTLSDLIKSGALRRLTSEKRTLREAARKSDCTILEAKRAGLLQKIKTLAKEGKQSTAQEDELRALDQGRGTSIREDCSES